MSIISSSKLLNPVLGVLMTKLDVDQASDSLRNEDTQALKSVQKCSEGQIKES